MSTAQKLCSIIDLYTNYSTSEHHIKSFAKSASQDIISYFLTASNMVLDGKNDLQKMQKKVNKDNNNLNPKENTNTFMGNKRKEEIKFKLIPNFPLLELFC